MYYDDESVGAGRRGVPLNKNPIIYQAEKVLKNEVLINERPLDIVQNIREIPGQKALEYHRNSHLFNVFGIQCQTSAQKS